MPQLVDKRRATLGVLAAVERIELGRDHVQGVVREEELREQRSVVPLGTINEVF